MKYCIIVPDGMADYGIESLGGKTPLEVARTVHMDELARRGRVGLIKTVPDGCPPGSDVANLALFGYDPRSCYTGRGPLEAANLGIEMGPADWAFRCNLITVTDGILQDYSAGHISTDEAHALIESLNRHLSNDHVTFYGGVSYRHLMMVRGGYEFDLATVPPHDVMGEPCAEHMPTGKGSEFVRELMEASRTFMGDHPVNTRREAGGQSPANKIWLWGEGKRPAIKGYGERFGLTGSVISAVDLVNGIGVVLGLKRRRVPGATGYYDTDYEGKGRAAIEELAERDFVYVHIEAPDEASHNGHLEEKIRAIERIDSLIVGPVAEFLSAREHRILVAPDHYTPIVKRTHAAEPVPFVLAGTGVEADEAHVFCESTCAGSGFVHDRFEVLESLLLK